MRNSERFLPLAAAAVSREAQALGEVALASTVATLLQEVSLYLATPSDEAAERLRGELSALREASLAHPPTLANALANLLAHAEVLLERHTPTETLFAEATSNDVSVQADALAQSLAFERARAEARATLYERGMLAAIAVLALFWIGLALQSRARAARAAPAEAEAPRPAPAPRLGAPEPSLRTPLALPDEPLEPAFGAIERELAGALPVPMGAEHAMLERFRAERTGESLAATAERLATRIGVLHHVQARLHAALKESDAMPELPDGSDLDEELEAGLAVAAHARREANAMADLAKRLATVASLPNGDAERDMVDVNACIEDILAATRADAAATVTRRLGDVPDIFASKTEVRLLLAQVLENSLRALEGVAGRPPTIKVDTAQRSDEILITVIDNGAGIPPERRQSIFRPFYTSHDGAMGLGLTLAGDLVRRYEGAIKVNSLPGQGTVTRITLPTGIPGP
ncbi:MAG: hypothetical protein F4169_19810 [Gammaproteobacteria bacterium]|nr:hypothetical protein [Gammaproteobacteria bacterium]